MTLTLLNDILSKHYLYISGDPEGVPANLSGANLTECRGTEWASCGWTGHGECGRQLLAVRSFGTIKLFCGCFSGSEHELLRYIANGDDRHKSSRTKALEFVISCFQ